MAKRTRMARAEIGIIGGSGLYDIDGLHQLKRVTVPTPFGSPSSSVVLGELDGVRVAFLSRHGHGHRFSPSEINYRANIYALKAIGVSRIISVSAVGSMKESIKPGDVVLPDQFIDLTKRRISTFFEGRPVSGGYRSSGRYLPLHGGSAILHEGGVALVPPMGRERHRNDEYA